MDDKLERLRDIKVENFVWIIYIGIILLSWYSNKKEKHYILFNDEKSKKEYRYLIILIFTILLFIYYYFAKDSYDDLKKLTKYATNKKRILTTASFIGSTLILISGIIFWIIAIEDENLDVEIAFN